MIDETEIRKIFADCKKLEQVPIPFEDLMECIIGIDVMEHSPEIADQWTDWLLSWLSLGYTEQESVNIFYAIVTAVYADAAIDGVMKDIRELLENQ